MNRLIYIVACVFALTVACADQVPQLQPSGGKKDVDTGVGATGNPEEKFVDPLPGTVDGDLKDIRTESPYVTQYPKFTFWGDGTFTHDSHVITVSRKVVVDISQSQLTVDLTIQESTGHKHSGEANKTLPHRTGTSVFQRVPVDELKEKEKSNSAFKMAPFIIFANSASKPSFQGDTRYTDQLTFSEPIPAYVAPSNAAQYKMITNGGTLTYSAAVTMNTQRNWRHTRNFTANITLKHIPSNDGFTHVHQRLIIPEDQKGELYGSFPTPYDVTYILDTKNPPYKIVRTITKETYRRDNGNGKQESRNMNFNVCSRTLSGKTDRFNGHLGGCNR